LILSVGPQPLQGKKIDVISSTKIIKQLNRVTERFCVKFDHPANTWTHMEF
jgi:hypothetical protein